MTRKNVVDNMPKLVAALARFYASQLGPLPAEELDVVEVPEYGFGIAPYGIVLITTEAFKARGDETAEIYSRGINSRLAHEVAHQWFGHRAWPVDLADNWLAESFAEYFSGIAMGVLATRDKTLVGFDHMLALWRHESKICDDAAPIIAANYLGGERGASERQCLLYDRGPLVLHMLRTMIGNDRFMAATRAFLDTTNDGAATTDDYASAVSATVGSDMRWFFDQWVRASGIPTVDVSTHVEGAPDGKYRLTGTIRQAGGAHFKKLMVPLVFELNGKAESRVVFADQPEKSFDFLLDRRPGMVKVDPFRNNLAVYK
jgi:aminopeptidase N